MAEPTPVPPLPTPTDVAPGTACVDDDGCVEVKGFCRALAGGGMECATYRASGESCGGVVAPSDIQRCVPGLECDAPDANTEGTCVCTPDCTDRICGSDGCGGSCGSGCEDGLEVCAAEGTLCNDFVGDRCCNPVVVGALPFERHGRVEGAEDTFDVPLNNGGGGAFPDEVIAFEPTETGTYLVWGNCKEAALYDECGASTYIDIFECFSNALSQVELTAGETYYFGEQPADGRYTRRINGPVRTFGTLAAPALDIVADETHVYWSSESRVFRSAKDGTGAVQTLLSIPVGRIVDIEVVGATLYAVDAQNGSILSVPKVGGVAPTVLATNQQDAGALAVTANYVYWTIRNGNPSTDCDLFPPPQNGAVRRRLLAAGSTVEDVATDLDTVTDIAVDDTHVYWTLQRGIFTPSTPCQPVIGINRRTHGGGAIEEFGALDHYGRLVVTNDAIYAGVVRDPNTDGQKSLFTWRHYNKATLAEVRSFPEVHLGDELVVDGEKVYMSALNTEDFTGFYGGSVMLVDPDQVPSIELGLGFGIAPRDPGTEVLDARQFTISEGRVYLEFDGEIISLPAAN